MTDVAVRSYLVMTPDDRAHIIEADNVMVDELGNLNMWLKGRALVGAFGRGFWCSCTAQQEAKRDD